MMKAYRALTARELKRFESKVHRSGDCHTWLAGRTSGAPNAYGGFYWQGRQHPAHRIAYFIATGVWPGTLFVCHTCDNPLCVRAEHLFLGTTDENMADMVSKNRQVRGSRVNTAKITDATAEEIRARYGRQGRGGLTQKELAEEYGLHQTMISLIVRGKNWSNPDDSLTEAA